MLCCKSCCPLGSFIVFHHFHLSFTPVHNFYHESLNLFLPPKYFEADIAGNVLLQYTIFGFFDGNVGSGNILDLQFLGSLMEAGSGNILD